MKRPGENPHGSLLPLVRAGLVCLALLALGEAAPAAFPVRVVLESDGTTLSVQADGGRQTLPLARLAAGPRTIRFQSPGPAQREIQIDGTDTTATADRDAAALQRIQTSPLYRLAAWLRDESSYSRWERIRLRNAEGVTLAEGRDAVQRAVLPAAFRLEAALRRPEAPAAIWLDLAAPGASIGFELDRDRRNARWLIQQNGTREAFPRRFFPEQPLPFLANLLNLLGRSAAAAFGLLLAAPLLARLRPGGFGTARPDVPGGSSGAMPPPGARGGALLLLCWFLAAAAVSVVLYRQLPHILDAVSYSFQAGLFRAGRLWLDATSLPVDALKGPFQVIRDGRWFSQYPPGAPLAYAAGGLLGLDWLVGPLAGTLLLGATASAARSLYGPRVGLATLLLGAMSPFLLFQAGSFLSHPIAGAALAGAFAVFAHLWRVQRNANPLFALVGALLGFGFITREAASVLFALPLAGWLLLHRRGRAFGWLLAGGAPFAVVYAAYTAALTGNPLLLPRVLFSPNDRFGFGDGMGFHQRHTPAAGFANTDALLTLLQFDLFGWPPLFALGLLLVPFLLGRPDRRDLLVASGFALFVGAYWAYFYHGIALGPRYYFEALPWLLVLAGRACQVLARTARSLGAGLTPSRLAVGVLVGLLSLNTALYYLPRQVERLRNFSALPGGRGVALPFVRPTLFGPRMEGIPAPSLVLVADWWLFNAVLSSLNCPALQDCAILFAFAPAPLDEQRLRDRYPGRSVLRALTRGDRVAIEPAAGPGADERS